MSALKGSTARCGNWNRAVVRRVILGVAALLIAAPAASADWQIRVAANPVVAPGSPVQYMVRLSNPGPAAIPSAIGGDADNCTPGAPAPPSDPAKCYSVTARFPTGITPTGGESPDGTPCVVDGGANAITCTVSGHEESQQIPALAPGVGSNRLVTITADVAPDATGTLTSSFDVSGGETGGASAIEATTISSAPPEFGVAAFDGQVTADAGGSPFTQAGGRPFAASTSIEFMAVDNPNPLIGTLWPVEALKDVVVELPPGFIGNPTTVDTCTMAQLTDATGAESRPLCPPTAQVGNTLVQVNTLSSIVFGPVPIYNMLPPPDVPARFGFNVQGTVVVLDAEVRTESDYGVTILVRNVSQGLPVQGTSLTLWGVPSHPSHDAEHACPGIAAPWATGISCPSGAPQKAFLRNPTSCTPAGVGLSTTIRVDSWQDPGDFKEAAFETHLPPAYPSAPDDWGAPQGPTDCDRVPFNPSLRGTPAADARGGKPSGFTFDLALPQTDDPEVVGTADLRRAVVTLPQGLRVSPGSADGLAACSSAQIGLDNREFPTCPAASKIGSLTIDTPLLDEQLTGGIYLATPFDNPFDSLIAVYLVARGPGVVIKLPGSTTMDPRTGQITATFDDNPQVPFSNLHLEFKGGPRAPLALPKRCGTYTTRAELTSWSGRTVVSESSFTVDDNCGHGFTPSFEAGTEDSAAGRSSPFLLRLTRDDADEELAGLSLDMPRGFVGRIADVTLCGEGDARNGTCQDSSKIGTVVTGAGAGANPFFITNGRAYLTGPYKGAPFGLSVVVPAVAGPFDLGTVNVRQALFVDKHTAEVRVVSDPLPTILEGIPLDVRDVRVSVDRPGFWLNPTSCAEKTIRGTITSTEGSTAPVSTRYQAYDCASLPLRPKMTLTVGGRGRTRRGRTTPFTARLTQTPGQANLRSVRVALPISINARLDVVNRACTRAEFEAANCEKARAGSAVAVTPLLRDPLRGNAYFVRNGNPIPDLFVALKGQVDFDLIGKVSIPGGKRLGTTFDLVPDVPITSFTLKLVSGRQGPVGNAANLCSPRARRAKAQIDFVGQNGKSVFLDQRLKVKGCRASRRGRRARGRGARKRGR